MLNEQIADHYDQDDLVGRIEAGFAASGKAPDDVTVDDLALVDEFHTGGRRATEIIAANLGLEAGTRVLDVGSGLGGPARYVASTFGCTVLGVDLTPSFVDAATTLTGWVGLEDRVTFLCAAAQDVPADAGPFDAAYLFHVGMNVADKAVVFAGIAGQLRPGARLAVYDLMRVGEGELTFPLPWSSAPETSFVEPPTTYEAALVAAGFAVESVTRHDEIAAGFIEVFRQGASAGGPPPVGLHLVMGPTTPQKGANLIAAIEQGVITPVQIVASV